MVFKEKIIFPDTLAFGAQGGRSWKTGVVRTGGGQVNTNQDLQAPLGRWQVSLENRTIPQMLQVRALMNVVRGRVFAFRFKAPFDSHITRVPARRLTETTFQVRQRSTAGGETPYIDVKKPKFNDPTLRVSLGDMPTTDFTLNTTNGILTTREPQYGGTVVYVTLDYHIPVMFGTDLADFAYIDPGFATWSSIELFEVPIP